MMTETDSFFALYPAGRKVSNMADFHLKFEVEIDDSSETENAN